MIFMHRRLAINLEFICTVRQFCEKLNSFMVITSKTAESSYFFSFSLVYISLVGSVNIANGQIDSSESTNFNRIQGGAWLKVIGI